jgi:hypothetical protein
MKRIAFLAITVLVGASFVVLTGLYFSKSSAQSTLPVLAATSVGMIDTPNGAMNHAVVELSSWPDSVTGDCHGSDGGNHPDWVTFCSTTDLELPAHSLVTIKISQYDGGETITNAYFAQVHGTIDGTATVDGFTFTQIPADSVGHTFTIHGIPSPSQDDLFVSVPLQLTEAEGETPKVVEFSFYTGSPGTYFWNCEFPCGDGTYARFGGPMSMQGYMAGHISVV